MGITVGGERAWRTRRKGELFISYQWLNGSPAMLIYPVRPSPGAGCYAIPLESAWKYADSETGAPTLYLIQQADVAASVMRMLPTRDTIKAIADAIVDGLPDLVEMPPEPASFSDVPKGEMKLQVDGSTVAHVGTA